MGVFFISDTHFGDNGIIKYENRPFKDKDEYIQETIKRWNNVINDDDEVFHLGDVAWNMSADEIKAIITKLKGHKYLIMGNHDHDFTQDEWKEIGFEKVYDVPILYEGFYILSHEPLYMLERSPYVNVFGHVHGNPMYKDVSSVGFCACVERTNYAPVDFGIIMDTIAEERLFE